MSKRPRPTNRDRKRNGTKGHNRKLSRRTLLTGLGAGLTLTSLTLGSKSAFAVTPQALPDPALDKNKGHKANTPFAGDGVCFDFVKGKVYAVGTSPEDGISFAGYLRICVDCKNKQIKYECPEKP
jgi:hypothetical protein